MAAILPGEERVTIVVPRVYQEYLVAGRDRFLAVILAALIGLVLVFGFGFKRWSVDTFDFTISTVAAVSWLFQRRRRWHYTVDQKMVTTIWAQANGWLWDWRTIFWARTPITGVEETEWRGLPAIRLLGGKRSHKQRPDWLIVYAPEDMERVRTYVLPLIERYRKQYRQDSLAERLRQ